MWFAKALISNVIINDNIKVAIKMNYSDMLEEIIDGIKITKIKPRLLLHVCCAPCASYCLQYLKDFFEITALYYNPNIDSLAEYEKRGSELKRFVAEYCSNVETIVLPWDGDAFLNMAKGLEGCREGGERCALCYTLRLEKAAEMAAKDGFDYFASTLSISPLKDSGRLNLIGQALSEKYEVKNLPNDFKKKGGYLQSTLLSKDYNLYRQNYCGCIFSKVEQQQKELSKSNDRNIKYDF